MTSTDLYRSHLQALDTALADALECAGRQGLTLDAVLFHAGRDAYYHRDDEHIPFRPAAHFSRWVPLRSPEHVVLARPGQTPKVARVTPPDFWYETTPGPRSYWEDAVDLVEVASFEEALAALGTLGRCAYIGPTPEAAEQAGIDASLVEPEALLAPLDWARATKTEHEVACLHVAAEATARGFAAVADAFAEGASERELFRTYLAAADVLEKDLPYAAIVALDEKSAILHYQNKRGPGATPGATLLLDAGAAHDGYAADVTRTWARPDADATFRAMAERLDALERELVDMVTPGRPYPEIHVATHRGSAEILCDLGILKVGAEEAFDRGLTRTFMPHGVGHHLGLQVHDVGGHQAAPEGGTNPPPEEYAWLRNTRVLEPAHVVTIEPGLYFIPMLLEPLRASTDAAAVDWALVDRLTPCGGLRIEDNIVCTDGEPIDLTRSLIDGPRGPVD